MSSVGVKSARKGSVLEPVEEIVFKQLYEFFLPLVTQVTNQSSSIKLKKLNKLNNTCQLWRGKIRDTMQAASSPEDMK